MIELLIVIAIILILIAIALPNFLEAQIRAQVTRVRGELRTLGTALESYSVDYRSYPPRYSDRTENLEALAQLGYLGEGILLDPLNANQDSDIRFYEYGSGRSGQYPSSDGSTGLRSPNDTWLLESDGPDNIEDTAGLLGDELFPTLNYPCWPMSRRSNVPIPCSTHLVSFISPERAVNLLYAPTNGSRSRGNIMRAGGKIPTNPALLSWRQTVDSW